MNSIKDKIKEIRKESGLSQTKFATKLGFSRSYITQLESGKTTPSFEFLENLFNEFNTPPGNVFDYTPKSTNINTHLNTHPNKKDNLVNIDSSIDFWDTDKGQQSITALELYRIEDAKKCIKLFAKENNLKPLITKYNILSNHLKFSEIQKIYDNTPYEKLTLELKKKYAMSVEKLLSAINEDLATLVRVYLLNKGIQIYNED